MLAVPLVNMQGERIGEMQIAPESLGGRVRTSLLKQAIVAYRDHQRQHSARTKSRGQVEGSTRKLYRQKGTGNARAGSIRGPIRRGGGHTFAKAEGRAFKGFPKKMRRLARSNALLAKVLSGSVVVLDELHCPEPKTKVIASMLTALGVEGGCLLATSEANQRIFLAGRNIPDIDIRPVDQLNAYEILRRPKVIFTKKAFERFNDVGGAQVESASQEQGTAD